MILNLILALFSLVSQTENSKVLKIYTSTGKKDMVLLAAESNIEIRKKPFTLTFKGPKEQTYYVRLHSTFNDSIYNAYLKHKDLSQLKAWKTDNTMAVPIVETFGNDKVLRIKDGSTQGYIHKNVNFTSFATIDSTENELIISKTYSVFKDMSETYYSASESYKFKKAKKKTIYCIVEFESVSKEYESEEILVVPFTIEI